MKKLFINNILQLLLLVGCSTKIGGAAQLPSEVKAASGQEKHDVWDIDTALFLLYPDEVERLEATYKVDVYKPSATEVSSDPETNKLITELFSSPDPLELDISEFFLTLFPQADPGVYRTNVSWDKHTDPEIIKELCIELFDTRKHSFFYNGLIQDSDENGCEVRYNTFSGTDQYIPKYGVNRPKDAEYRECFFVDFKKSIIGPDSGNIAEYAEFQHERLESWFKIFKNDKLKKTYLEYANKMLVYVAQDKEGIFVLTPCFEALSHQPKAYKLFQMMPDEKGMLAVRVRS